MSNGKMITLYKNDSVELILNQRKNQIVLLDCSLSEMLRNVDDYNSLKISCKIDESNSLFFDNTYRYLLMNDYVSFRTNNIFNEKVYQWQDSMVNIVSNIRDSHDSQNKIFSDDLLVNEFIVVLDTGINLDNLIFKTDSGIYTVSKKVVAWISINSENSESRMKWIFEHYNYFDDIVIIIEDDLDLQVLSNCLFKDTNNKISYQLFISDFVQYRNMWDFFYELGYVICFSSRLFCLYTEMNAVKNKEISLIVSMIKNSAYCLSSLNKFEELSWEIIFPYTINCTTQDFLYNAKTSELYRPERICARNDCSFNKVCPYQCSENNCEYKSMMAQMIGIDE